MDADTSDIIDDEWINEYKHEEEKYDIFYKKEVTSIKLFFIYISSHDEIEKIIKDKYNIINKSISKKELTEIIKEHATRANKTDANKADANKADTNKAYILNSIFKYNITLKPDEIEDFINNENEYENDYMSNISLQDDDEEFQDILFENTIDFLKDLNAIYIFYTKPAEAQPALVRKKLKKTKKNTHNSIKNNKTSKNQKNLKII